MKSPVTTLVQRTLVAGLLWLGTSLTAPAQGTIRYVPSPDVELRLGDTPWDVDGDGAAEFVFRASPTALSIYPQAGSFVLAFASPPPDIGADVVPLIAPSEIGQYDYTPAQWVGSLHPSGFPGRAHLNGCVNLGCSGTFYGVRAYFGFSFELDGQIHYGWGLFNASAGAGGYLESYAYNLEPGASIFVGQVPEPGTWALLTIGAGLLGWRGWRRRNRV